MSAGANRFVVEYDAPPEGGRVARLTIDNREKSNSLDSALLQQITDATAALGVRRAKAALSSGCKPHPAIRSSGKQSEQSWR